MTPGLFHIIEAGRRVEKEEILRKFRLASDYLYLKPEIVLSGGKDLLDLIAGAVELNLEPYIAFGFFHCLGTDSDPAHRIEYAIAIGERKQCPIHALNSVRDETANEAIAILRSELD